MIRHRFVRAAVGVGLAVGTLSACGGGSAPVNIAAIPVAQEAVDSVTFSASGRTATLRVLDGTWTPAQGATVQAATMLTAGADRYFPLNSYRIMEDINQNDPLYGLSGQPSPVAECRPECSMSVTDTAGKTWKLVIGGRTFNGGFYGKVEGDPRVFLITKETVAGIISEAIGKDFSFPASAAIRRVEQELQGNDPTTGQKKADLPDYDPFLRQVLAAEEVAACEKKKERDCHRILARAAASVQDQPGAKEGKEVQQNSQALTPTGADR